MSEHSGTALHATFAGVVISGRFRTLDPNEMIDLIDITAGADAEKKHINSHRDATIAFKYIDEGTDGNTIEQVLYTGNSGTLDWGPQGTANGMPRYTCVATVKSVKRPIAYDDAVMVDVEFQKNGDWVNHYNRQIGSGTWS